MRILIAVDFGLFGKAQTTFLHDYSAPDGSSLLVLHVIEPLVVVPSSSPSPFIATISPEVLTARRQAAQQLVEDVAERLRTRYTDVTTSVRDGSVGEEILAVAESWNADMILVGSHGRTGLQRFLLGSVSARIAEHAKCTVTIARSSAP